MKVIDQNSAAAALEKNLSPGPGLIDGRTEKERLDFLCRFAALINFYDNTNQLSGNWQPFLLKDPVFLLASISQTDYRKEHRLFVQTCANLQELITEQESHATPDIETQEEIVALFNQLFDQLTRVFLQIESWTHYMQMGSEEYDLKKYTIDQVKETYNSYLWAVLSLRNFMASSQVLSANTKNQILPVRQYVLDAFSDLIWTRGSGTTPFMQVLGLYPISELDKENEAILPSVSGPVPSGISISTQTYFNGLKYAGEQLFKFYRTIIHHAGPQYEKEKLKKSSYPDTLLLRTFSDLLKVQQEQLNGIANKHLHFYYTDILKQTEQPAVADSVFITIVLGKNITLFDLPAGTEFNAGTDANKNPIIFASKEDVSLNAAVISAVYTLAPLNDTGEADTPQLFLQNIAKPGTVATDESGQTLSWDTFGGTTNIDGTAATTAQMAFSFGSPMLYLPEGTREITISLGFETLPAAEVFTNALLFLSSATAWVPVTYTLLPATTTAPNTLSILIVLDATVPAIVPFTKSPDTVWSTWPMFKVVLNSFAGLAIPPVLTSIGIDVCVSGVNTLALYNDNGLLSTKTPFQPFGPIVNLNSNFLIGSNEIFSKPLSWLSIEVDWDALPQPSSTTLTPTPLDNGFGTYYNSYNAILFPDAPVPPAPLTPLTVQSNWNPPIQSPQTVTPPTATSAGTTATATPPTDTETTPAKTTSRIGKFFRKVWNVIKWPVTSIAGLFSEKKTKPPTSSSTSSMTTTAGASTAASAFTPPAPPVSAQQVPFANVYFTVGFSMLNYSQWDTFFMYNYGGNTNYATWLNSPCTSAPVWPDGKAIDFQLFDTSSGSLATKSVFGYFASQYDSPAEADPTIQQSTLTYDGSNASGFIKMTLTNPANGFGVSVYGAVVTDIVTQNAVAISKPRWPWSADPTILAAANVPFAPKVTAITAMYGASQVYDVTQASGSYPLQYFYYTPFASYTAYDNSPALEENYSVDLSMIGNPGMINGLQLVPSFTSNAGHKGQKGYKVLACDGAMYIGMTGLVPANAISLFFELSTTYTAPTSGAEVNYYYLSTTGWKALPLLNDGTSNFTCSGIITLNIPADITDAATCMPAGTYWIAIGASIDSAATLDLSSFAQVVLVAPNGVELMRTGTTYLTDTTAPVIAAGAITKPQNAIAEIGTVTQPFASFGGRAAEDQEQMYVRVSRRLKTKDRAVSGNDIFTLISQQFPDIYFSGTVFTPDTNLTTVYVVEGFDSYTDANAYRPYVSECEMEHITDFLQERVSLFSNITVSNYAFQQVSITADVTVKTGYVPDAMSATIAQALNIFLSPWIANSGQEQCIIGQPITGSQIAAFIRSIDGVATASGIELASTGSTAATNVQTLTPVGGTLFVSSLNHTITAKQVT